MASHLGPDGQPNLPVPSDDPNDPFSTTTSTHHRFSDVDQDILAIGPPASPTRAKRALEAHLAETDRRLDEAGKLGTALVSQRKALVNQLHQVEKLQEEGNLGPDLRKKLADIEHEYNELARESARVLLPKQRGASGDAANIASPYVPEGRTGRRSVSPSKFESQATGSPSKFGVPNRKLRNQPTSRVHDIEFAAEISTSLIAQVRNLQALLSERDEDVKNLQAERTTLEIDSDNLRQRVKTLDESENRYKEENWNLETRLQEFSSLQKEAADREKKLTQALHLASIEKNAAQKDVDDVRLTHARLAEEHAAAIKQHDIEIGMAKRSIIMADGEKASLQRRLDDLTSQNQELAKACAMQRARALDREPTTGMSDDDFETAADNITPEHSPPTSPIKGTPRHSMLEAETIKTSLHHAQRTIQSQRSQLHREKTEKLEMRRIIQDLRDDLEKARNDVGTAPSARRSRRVESKELKKPQRLLGNFRASRQEIVVDDAEWEDNPDSPPKGQLGASTMGRKTPGNSSNAADTTESFETANEATESGFETANERATETDDFQTGNEALSGSDDDVETETESPSRGFGRMREAPSLPASLVRHNTCDSFHSTASTSADEDDFSGSKSTGHSLVSQKSRVRLARGVLSRGSRQASEEATLRGSPASMANNSTRQTGQSLFAELQDMGGSDEDSAAGTPSRRSLRSVTPGSIGRHFSPPPPNPFMRRAMVDSGVMTDPVRITADVLPEDWQRPASMESVIRAPRDGAPSVASKVHGAVMLPLPASPDFNRTVKAHGEQGFGDKAAQTSFPPSSPLHHDPPTPPSLGLSLIQSQHVEPRQCSQDQGTPPLLRLTPLSIQRVEPRVCQPDLSMSNMAVETLEPNWAPQTCAPELTMTPHVAESVDPVAAQLPLLSLSGIRGEVVEPVAQVESSGLDAAALPFSRPVLGLSNMVFEYIEPVCPPKSAAGVSPTMGVSAQEQPAAAKETIAPALAMSTVYHEHTEPVYELGPAQAPLKLSSILWEHIPPAVSGQPAAPRLALSSLSMQQVEPVAEVMDAFEFVSMQSRETQAALPLQAKRGDVVFAKHDDLAYKDSDGPQTPCSSRSIKTMLRDGQSKPTPIIAEDETRQSPRVTQGAETPESQRPFKEISSNFNSRPQRKQAPPTSDQSAQTALTLDAMDKLFQGGSRQSRGDTAGSPDSLGTVRIYRSQESLGSIVRGKTPDDWVFATPPPLRPGTATSGGLPVQELPPLPSNHRQIIDAAHSGTCRGRHVQMAPPPCPASATRAQPRTPSLQRPASAVSGRGTPTPRAAARAGSALGHVDVQYSSKLAARSRQSSISSFASELDSRFNIRPSQVGMDPTGFSPNTDPRMIQAITQTMIGEFLWKYTRKAGRGELSENRHRRYFWVHPYTRTLYWSDRDPSSGGRTELRTKSVPIEAVRVVTDDNPMPPGLHRKSMIIISTGRTIKFTCTTGQRHETWFNALSYLLLRTNQFDRQSEAEELAGHITQEDVEEFNPQMLPRPVNGNRPRAPPSLSSYNSRTTRNDSAADEISLNVPTLTPSNYRRSTASRASFSTLSKLSGYWKSGAPKFSGTLSSFRGRGPASQSGHGVYEASEVHDSAEDLREMIERQDRDADHLENVRACCDGKHDVGTLHHPSKKDRGSLAHAHPGPSASSMSVAAARPQT
ncbi:hypothetical protein CDD82_7272 [Ophiocordyceps australis]|uniref:PH domain-containing protein n=1 Tax=Ophiocordyceps australis TaxID=1399860 RepID=A0A2C5ZPT6_9HYPO|nr:hypothetical protein CDD82_7272 [Ophiocordyceps australis]